VPKHDVPGAGRSQQTVVQVPASGRGAAGVPELEDFDEQAAVAAQANETKSADLIASFRPFMLLRVRLRADGVREE
jgi:hypothetical protein